MSSAAEQQKLDFFLKKINELPAFPGVVSELIRLIDNPLTSANQIERVLSTDSGLTLKTLRLANSAYYAIPGGAKTLNRAITHLGMSSLKQMVLTTAVFGQLDGKSTDVFNYQEFWRHSLYTASVAEFMAKQLNLGNPQDAFICGLVHDLGLVVYNMYSPEQFAKLVNLAKDRGIAFEDAEKEMSDEIVKHGIVGSMIAKKWNLPPVVQAAIRDHHVARQGLRSSVDKDINKTIDAVYLANRVVSNLTAKETGKPIYPFTEDEALKRNAIKVEDFEKLEEGFKKAVSSADSLLQSLWGKS